MTRVAKTRPWVTFRSLISAMGPAWLTTEKVETPQGRVETESRVLYALALVKDAIAERVRLGTRYRFPIPGETPEDAMLEIGHSRLTPKGPLEPLHAYAVRLRRWLDDWRLAGTPWAVMGQVQGYCSPAPVRLRIFNNNGDVFTLEPDGTRSWAIGTAWDWDGDTSRWSRWWLVIYPVDANPTDRQIRWGNPGSIWGQVPGTWGGTSERETVLALQRIIATRKAAGSRCDRIIVCYDPNHFDPTNPATLPDGTWAKPYRALGGVWVRTRFADAAYWPGA